MRGSSRVALRHAAFDPSLDRLHRAARIDESLQSRQQSVQVVPGGITLARSTARCRAVISVLALPAIAGILVVATRHGSDSGVRHASTHSCRRVVPRAALYPLLTECSLDTRSIRESPHSRIKRNGPRTSCVSGAVPLSTTRRWLACGRQCLGSFARRDTAAPRPSSQVFRRRRQGHLERCVNCHSSGRIGRARASILRAGQTVRT